MPSRSSTALFVLSTLFFALGAYFWFRAANLPAAETNEEVASESPHLVELMTGLQLYTHKLMLAEEAQNPELMEFYLHEMEEMSEEIVDQVPSYDGHPVANLVSSLLLPQLEKVDRAVEEDNWDRVADRVDDLARTCNSCHVTTDHGYIQIPLDPPANVYLQQFALRAE